MSSRPLTAPPKRGAMEWDEAHTLRRLEQLAGKLGMAARDVAHVGRNLESTNERALGRDSPTPRPMTRLPARLLRDASAGGGLEVALQCLIARGKLGLVAAETDHDFVAEVSALAAVAEALRGAGLLRWPRIYVSPSVPDGAEVAKKARAVSAEIVATPRDATHVVVAPARPHAQHEKTRTLAVDEARGLALVHWVHAPDSQDEWVDIERVGGDSGLSSDDDWRVPLSPRQWSVSPRFVTDALLHNEWGCELDYVVEAHPPKKRKSDLPPSRDESGVRAKRDVVLATVELPPPDAKPTNGRLALSSAVAPRVTSVGEAKKKDPDIATEVVKVEKKDDATTSSLVVEKNNLRPQQQPQKPSAQASSATKLNTDGPRSLTSEQLRRNVFDAQGVTPLERACCPEWFVGDSSKTPDHYLEARNWMIAQSNSRPQTLVTATFCRQRLGLDACATIRLFNFVDAWGLVNSQVPNTARRTHPKPVPKPPPFFAKERDHSKTWSTAQIRALVDAARECRDDWVAVSALVNRACPGSRFDAADCASRFVELALRDPFRGLVDDHHTLEVSKNGNHVDGESSSSEDKRNDNRSLLLLRDDDKVDRPDEEEHPGRDALDAYVEARLARLEHLLDRFAANHGVATTTTTSMDD